MVAHFINNAFILFAEKFGFYEKIAIPLFILSCVCLAVSVAFFALYERMQKPREMQTGGRASEGKKQFAITALVGVIVCAVCWLVGLISGF